MSPMLAMSGGIAVLQLCKEVYLRYKSVKRFRDDCKKLAHFVHRVEGFLMETEDEADMTGPGWQAAFTALHESLVEVSEVFDDCATFGIVRSLINADEINLRLSSIAQRMTMALQLIPIQKAKVTDRRLGELHQLQHEIHTAQFAAARAAEQQSAQLKRLMDQSRLDASKTQEMLTQVLQLLQADAATTRTSAAAAAAGPGPAGGPAAAAAAAVVCPAQLDAEVEDLKAERMLAQRNKNVLEEQYLAQIIAAIEAMEVTALEAQQSAAGGPAAPSTDPAEEVPLDLLCPITRELLEDPVILVDSHQTCERAAIEEWLGRGNSKDPVTGIQLQSALLVPNVLARKLAEEWLQQHPSYCKAAAESTAAAAAVAPQAAVVDMAFKKPMLGGSSSSRSASCSVTAAEKNAAGNTTSSAAVLAAAADSCLGSSCSSSWAKTACQLQLEQQDSDEFRPNPKTEAILAATQSNMFDPAVLVSKQQQLQHEFGLDEKAAAHRAYAAAVADVAAAAEADARQEPVAVYSVLRSRSVPDNNSSPGFSGSTSQGLQPMGPAVSLPAAAMASSSAYGLAPTAAAAAADATTAAAAAAADASTAAAATAASSAAAAAGYTPIYASDEASNISFAALSDQLGHMTLYERQHLQQQQQPGQRDLRHAQSCRPSIRAPDDRTAPPLQHSSSSSVSSRAAPGSCDTVTLEDFRATFGHMAQTRTHIAMKHGSQTEKLAEAQRAERAHQMRQEVKRQESARRMPSYEGYPLHQLQEETEFYHQYSGNIPEHDYHQEQQQRGSAQYQQRCGQYQQNSSNQQLWDYPGDRACRETSAPAAFYGSRGSSSSRFPAPLPPNAMASNTQAALMNMLHSHSMPVTVSKSGSTAAAAAEAYYKPYQSGASYPRSSSPTGSTSSARSGNSGTAAHPAQLAAAPAAAKSGSSKWAFGRKKSSKSGDDVAFDDTESVRSDASMVSKRSVGKGMMSVLKNISYSIKYDDEKC